LKAIAMPMAAALILGTAAGCANSPQEAADRQQAVIEEMQAAEAANRQAEAAERRPNHLALARDLVQRGFYEVALVQLEEAGQQARQNPEIDFLIGVCHRETGRLDEAEAAFRRALSVDADYASAHDGLGLVFERQARPEAAAACFQKAVALDPARAEFCNNLGFALLARGRLQEAEIYLRRSLALDPAYQTARNNLAICYGYQGREADALALLLDRNRPPVAYRNMGAVYRLMGDGQKAEAMDRKAQTLEAAQANRPPAGAATASSETPRPSGRADN
jgi:Flp pilus assembly protein TadD